jgi:hypothetical protein
VSVGGPASRYASRALPSATLNARHQMTTVRWRLVSTEAEMS